LAPVKQLETLSKHETKLRAAIAKESDPERIEEAAARVREAQLRVLKARFALIEHEPASEERERQVRRIEADEAYWSGAAIDEIIQRYREAR
jgi:hypothetical protein